MPTATKSIWQALLNRRMLICIFIGFSSGLPYFVFYNLIPAWLSTEGVSLREIGLFALVSFPYTWKFLWAPAMERFIPPFLGHRRGWMLITQLALVISIAALGFLQPEMSIVLVAWLAGAIAFFSASQDIVLDAYRRELLPDDELGLGNSIHVTAYRVSALIPGSLGLILADHIPWREVFVIIAAFMFVGIVLTALISEAQKNAVMPRNFKEAVINPFSEFINRKGWRSALLILGFMFLYKLGDTMATALSTPFYLDLGFTKTEIGVIAKNAALWPAIIGGLLGGLLMVKTGINRALWLFGFVQIVTILGFAALAEIGNNNLALATVVALEYLGVGLGTAAFVAFIAKSTSKHHVATQFALFTAFAATPRTFANAITGYLVEGYEQDNVLTQTLALLGLPENGMGWTNFFLFCTAMAIPGMLMLLKVAPWNGENKGSMAIENSATSVEGKSVL
ncbi:MAG TPA: AmpG family muropeptide MFS transporter [Pseudomonadales bacterium]